MDKGEQLGGFKMGSTVVLVFEAPEDFAFTVEPGQKLIYGEPIGQLAGPSGPAAAAAG